MVKKYQHHRRERHDFPNNQKGESVLNHAHEEHGEVEEQEHNQVQT